MTFSAAGMLRRLPAAQGKKLKLVVDGKQRVVTNKYTVVTLAFIVCRQETSWTTLSPGQGRRQRLELTSCTAQPFLQCLMPTESEPDMIMAFEDAIEVCAAVGGLDLKKQIMQVHKDYALGIEAARARVFPQCRTIGDYFHMRRNLRTTVPAKLRRDTEPAKGGRQRRRGGRDNAGRPENAKGRDVLELVEATRMLPTVELFDAIWQVEFAALARRGEEALVKYLKDTYFPTVPLDVLRRVFPNMGGTAWETTHAYLAPHWTGAFGVYPGTGSGSLSIEAFHATWERTVGAATKPNVTELLPSMQRIYHEWREAFGWGRAVVFSNFPRRLNPALLNSTALHHAGRSTARDFWEKREGGNYVKVARQTGNVSGDLTEFYVMQTHRRTRIYAADAKISRSTAVNVVELLTRSGTALGKLLQELGIVTGSGDASVRTVDRERLTEYLVDHCVVVHGHLPGKYWKRRQRVSGEEIAWGLCTCMLFVQHAECEHVAYVAALRGAGVALDAVPEVRQRGRKRKTT